MTQTKQARLGLLPKHTVRALGFTLVGLLTLTAGCAPRTFNNSGMRSSEIGSDARSDADTTASKGHDADEPIADDAPTQRVADDKAGLLLEQALSTLKSYGATMEVSDLCPDLQEHGKKLFDGARLPDKPTKEVLAYFSILSSLAYFREEKVKPWADSLGFQGFTRVYDKTTDTTAYVFEANNFLVVSFSGTASLANWATDIDLVFDKTLFKAAVHKGFLRAYRGGRNGAGMMQKGVRSTLLEALNKHGYPKKKMYFTGHSLGGALTTLLASDIKVLEQFGTIPDAGTKCEDITTTSDIVGGVVTFGSTRIGNMAFAQCYNRVLGEKTWRVVNNFDFFPLMATRQFYAHSGTRVFLNDDGIDFKPGQFEEPQQGLMNFMTSLAKGGILANAIDHVSYTSRLGHWIENRCHLKHPLARAMRL